jgi:hypothetical protein
MVTAPTSSRGATSAVAPGHSRSARDFFFAARRGPARFAAAGPAGRGACEDFCIDGQIMTATWPANPATDSDAKMAVERCPSAGIPFNMALSGPLP